MKLTKGKLKNLILEILEPLEAAEYLIEVLEEIGYLMSQKYRSIEEKIYYENKLTRIQDYSIEEAIDSLDDQLSGSPASGMSTEWVRISILDIHYTNRRGIKISEDGEEIRSVEVEFVILRDGDMYFILSGYDRRGDELHRFIESHNKEVSDNLDIVLEILNVEQESAVEFAEHLLSTYGTETISLENL